MNSVQRVLSALRLEPVDQTPVLPVMLMQGAKVLDMTLEQYFRSPGRIAEGQLRLLEKFEHDAVFAFPHIVQDVLPWGADIDFHPDGPPSINRLVITDLAKIDDLRVPDATKHPYLAHTLEACRALAREVKGEKLIVGAVIGPFSLPSMLMGTKGFLNLLVDPQLRQRYLRRLLEKSVEFSAAWARAQYEAGCDLVVFAEGMSSATIIDEKTFVNDAKPVLADFIRRAGVTLAMEFVGWGEPLISVARDLPMAGFLIGSDDDPVRCRRAMGPSKVLIGNVNNLKLLRWDPERVQFEAQRVIASAGPGLILGNQGPEIPWETPDAAITALVAAGRSAALKAAA